MTMIEPFQPSCRTRQCKPQLTDPTESYTLLVDSDAIDRIVSGLEYAAIAADNDAEAYSNPDDVQEAIDRRELYRELSQELRVATGRAHNLEDHFTLVMAENGDALHIESRQVMDESNPDYHHLWSVVEADDGSLVPVPGEASSHFYYLKTVEPWDGMDRDKDWVY